MGKQILLVDDEPQLLYSLTEYFGRMGYDTTPAESGAEALGLLVGNPPDLIVSDIMMEDMDGFELQRRVKTATGDSIPFIFLTAKTDARDRIAGLRGGADDYVTKPFEPDELVARVEAVLHRVEQTRREEKRDLETYSARILDQVAARLCVPAKEVREKLKLIHGDHLDANEVEKQRYLREAIRDAEFLCQLIEDLSWVATDEDGKTLQISPNRVAPILRAAASSVARLAEQQSLDLSISCGGLLTGNVDAPALTRALASLLESIIELSPQGALIRISALRSNDGGIEFVLTHGPGGAVSREALEQASPGSVPNPPDALALARHVVRGHQGRFGVRQEDDGAHSYVIWIPGRVVRHVGKRV
jgi:DNA-binding response OmpR family regulator